MAKKTNNTEAQTSVEETSIKDPSVEITSAEETSAEEKLLKIVVIKRFRDKNDHRTWYEAGVELKFDESRANDVVERGLAKLCDSEGNKDKHSGVDETLNSGDNGNDSAT